MFASRLITFLYKMFTLGQVKTSFLASRLVTFLFVVLLCGYQVHGASVWTDATMYIQNPTLAGEDARVPGWEVEDLGMDSWGIVDGCVEFRGGAFRLSQQVVLPPGHYRLSLLGFYRNDYNSLDNMNYRNGEWESQGFFYAGGVQEGLMSVYAHGFKYNVLSSCWAFGQYFPAKSSVATYAFGKGMYVNELEFDSTGDAVEIGVFNEISEEVDCWCALGGFKLEREYGATNADVGNVMINEVMSANVDMFFSPVGNLDGWVELYNPTDSPVMTEGCYVSDDEECLKKWRMKRMTSGKKEK